MDLREGSFKSSLASELSPVRTSFHITRVVMTAAGKRRSRMTASDPKQTLASKRLKRVGVRFAKPI